MFCKLTEMHMYFRSLIYYLIKKLPQYINQQGNSHIDIYPYVTA